jgi:AAA+ superfamily predicted ATPase
LELVTNASQIANIDMFAANVCRTLRNPARSIGALIGLDPAVVGDRIAATAPLRTCGLVTVNPAGRALIGDSDDERMLALAPRIERVLLTPYATMADLTADILGQPCRTNLGWDDFAHIPEAGMAATVLRAAAAGAEHGIHVMLVGIPGTGKTELAKTLAAQAGLSLYAAGEAENEAGKEPSRSERSASLRLTMALLGNRRDATVLLDEAEDVLDSTRSFGEKRDAFSKAFLHRMLESSPVPVIWTCNHIDWMEPATLRRMTLVLRVGVPNDAGRERIWRKVLDGEGLSLAEDAATRLAARWEASAGIAAGAARAARLAGGAEDALKTALSGVARAVGVTRPARKRIEGFDPELIVCTDDLTSIVDRLARPGASRGWSLCLSGPSGTGKTVFAHYLADRLGVAVLQKRASNLLSMWVGGTEKQIAVAFSEAEDKEALLLIDEVESLLFDRKAAVRAFEVSQVDELLGWMEQHPFPLICTTNLPERMDQAIPRRFTFKLRFEALDAARAMLAFRRMLGGEPAGPLPDGLTPGDFAVVRRKAELLGEDRPAIWLRWLAEGLAAKGNTRPIGFRPATREPTPPIRLSRFSPAA